MAYNITKSDGTPVAIPDNGIDTLNTTLGLIGRNTVDFGAIDNQNLVRMLEHFAADTSPDVNIGSPATEGQLWWDKLNQSMKVYDGVGSWVSINSVGTGDFNPGGDLTSDLGTPALRWHTLYAAHGYFDTTGDVDGFDAIQVTGNGTLFGTGNAIVCDTDGGYALGSALGQLGDVFTINNAVSGVLTVGTATFQGGLTGGSNPAIIPSTGIVSLGTTTSRFEAALSTVDMTGMTNTANRIDLGNNTSIVPTNDKTSDLGTATERFRNIYAEDFYEDDDGGTAIKLEDKYLSKIGITNVEGTLVLDNGTSDTPQLVFNNVVTPSFIYMDMLTSSLRIVGKDNEAYPGTTPGSPRVLATFEAADGELRLSNVNTGGISLPNDVSLNVRNTSNATNFNAAKMDGTNNLVLGDTGAQTIVQASSLTSLLFTADGTNYGPIYHEGNPQPIPDIYLLTAGDTMTGTITSDVTGSTPALYTSETASSIPIILDDGDIKFTVHDGGGNFNLKVGVDVPGAIDTYREDDDGATKTKWNYANANGGFEVFVAPAAANVGKLAGDDITYNGYMQFVSDQTTNALALLYLTSIVGGISYRTLIYQGLFGAFPFSSFVCDNNGGIIGLGVKNGAGVDTGSVLYGSATPGIGVLTDGELHVTGNVVANSSDRRLKDKVEPITNAVEKVSQLNGVTFEYNQIAADAGFTAFGRHAGVFSQDVAEVLPEAVCRAPFDRDIEGGSKSGKDYMTVQYEKLVPLLIEAVKEQQEQIDELKAMVSALTEK